MIDKKLLMNSIKAKKEELADQGVKIHKDCMNNLRDMNYSSVIINSINLHVIEDGIRILNKNAVETVRKHKQDYLLSMYGVAEPSQRQPVRNKKEIQK